MQEKENIYFCERADKKSILVKPHDANRFNIFTAK